MKKKAISACIGTLAMSMVLVSGVTTSAKVAASEQNVCISTEQNLEENELNAKSPLFTTKYVVNVKKATMRSGPGTSYSSMGTLYKVVTVSTEDKPHDYVNGRCKKCGRKK